MKKQLLRTLTASILLMSTSVLAQEAPSRTECIAPAKPGGGSLLNLSQGKFGRYGVDDVRWLASVGTDYGMIAVRADSPWKTLKDLMTAMEKDPNSVVIGAGASIGSQDWMKSALLAQKANVDPHKMRYVAFEGGGDAGDGINGQPCSGCLRRSQ